jgi:SAM-dependent methyltransferase
MDTTTEGRLRTVRALPGTHELVVQTALRYVKKGARTLDLGAGSGALAEQLKNAGFNVMGVDISDDFSLDVEFVQADLNDPNFAAQIKPPFDLITSVEVIEHLENPTAFLRSIDSLLSPSGVAILTTPNVENAAARIKYFLSGKLRIMDHHSPEHITPIHLDLFTRQLIPRANLQLVDTFPYPKGEFPLTGRTHLRGLFWLFMPLMRGAALTGDTNFFILKRADASARPQSA